MKTHGDPRWESFPSYFDIFIPYILDLLEHFNIKITFFIVGQDAALEKNHEFLSSLTERGHEVGNHSFHHEPWLHLYPIERIKKEIIESEEHIHRVTGEKPNGFRGPGFSWSPDLIEVLVEAGYLYDASTLPTYLGPFARVYYFWKSNLNERERAQREKLFGSFKNGRHPVSPYYWQLASGEKLLEIPVTTIPFLKTPFHLSYLLYLSRISAVLMLFYLKVGLSLCRLTRTEPSFLLHPLDFLDAQQVPELAFFPGMDLTRTRKYQIFERVLEEFKRSFTLVNLSSHLKSILERETIPNVEMVSCSGFAPGKILSK